ncbi:hypothetical protein [Spartinivicinus poritis]|uniref:Uncharacterized protein n=1 Tax=Spartinivicinus poritis TaxID=2994640 RepID=A0ABT5U834_9GAMM|nr:hypothetical protein [Spartinivicinus sp. A2-2]MDE1462166.1 hypothetical protein [Spartinivicinus sp. A2-2]
MAIELNKIVGKIAEFQEEQVKQFKAFVDLSIELSNSANASEKKAQQTFTDLKNQLLQETNNTGDKANATDHSSPLLILEKNQAYVEKLDHITDPEMMVNNTQQYYQYIEKQNEQVLDAMKQRQKMNE